MNDIEKMKCPFCLSDAKFIYLKTLHGYLLNCESYCEDTGTIFNIQKNVKNNWARRLVNYFKSL
jgi:hypothetical protein